MASLHNLSNSREHVISREVSYGIRLQKVAKITDPSSDFRHSFRSQNRANVGSKYVVGFAERNTPLVSVK